MMKGKREGTLFLIFILFCILATGFYDRVFDDYNFSEKDRICQDGDDDLDYSFFKSKEFLKGFHSFHSLRLVTGFYFLEFFEKASFESASFLFFFSYRAPPIQF
jgi:hypothetical protein